MTSLWCSDLEVILGVRRDYHETRSLRQDEHVWALDILFHVCLVRSHVSIEVFFIVGANEMAQDVLATAYSSIARTNMSKKRHSR